MTDEVKHEKCSGCKCWRLPTDFLNKTNRKLKTCNKCRERRVKKCPHNRQKSRCKECGGSQICIHDKRKSRCNDCGGSSICIHNRQKSRCKDCGGSQICIHDTRKSQCKECGGSSICIHNRQKSQCKECGGSSICIHNRQKSTCKECGGSSICIHDKIKSTCKDCGGSSICIHDKRKSRCKECGGSSICIHNREKSTCKDCDPIGYLSNIIRSRVYGALKNDKELSSKEYLGCSIGEFKEHIEKQFKDDMTWDNYGEWHIDHITPLKYNNPTIGEVKERLHWTNTQPLWAADNIAKGNRFIG